MKLRIHGDNIIECERALKLVSSAYRAEIEIKNKNIFMPSYALTINNEEIMEIELFAGHGRWDVDFNVELSKHGAPLREATDAYITKILDNTDTEKLLLAIEFCNALPAGNNAWQRSGRAITCAEIGVPYFYYAEIGGVELERDRSVKAVRFPNPIVPFSYLTASKSLNTICVPVYVPHPAINKTLKIKFSDIFGLEDSLVLLRSIIENTSHNNSLGKLILKGTKLVNILSNQRMRIDTFRSGEWNEFLNLDSGIEKADWITKNKIKQVWKRKITEKVKVTNTFRSLLSGISLLNCYSIGAQGLPICLVDKNKIQELCLMLRKIYSLEKINSLCQAIEKKNKPIIIVWVTGFKPRGDDSRPDRGLVPLVRMLFGNDLEILSIVFGPAYSQTWAVLQNNPKRLARGNGLWQSLLNLSNYILADSVTSQEEVITAIIERNLERKNSEVVFDIAKTKGVFSEHDVDTAIHTMFSRQISSNIFESMCNPPGGDWSGISYLDFSNKVEYRWTSLPRVSLIQAKRPDHILQIQEGNQSTFLVIESKSYSSDLEKNIGLRLKEYVDNLFKISPTAYKGEKIEWEFFGGVATPLINFKCISGAAFIYKTLSDMKDSLKKGKLDFVIAFEFKESGNETITHILLSEKSKFLTETFLYIASQFVGSIKIEIY